MARKFAESEIDLHTKEVDHFLKAQIAWLGLWKFWILKNDINFLNYKHLLDETFLDKSSTAATATMITTTFRKKSSTSKKIVKKKKIFKPCELWGFLLYNCI